MGLPFYGNRNLILLFILFFLYSTLSFGQDNPEPLDRLENREVLNYHSRLAKEFADKNINKIAIDHLQSYDHLLDSLFTREKEDTLAVIAANFKSVDKDRKVQIEFLKNQITQLTTQKNSLDKRYFSFLKKSIISFIIWLIIVLLLIKVRSNKLKKSKLKVEESKTRLKSIEDSALRFDNFSKNQIKLNEIFNNLSVETNKINSKISSLTDTTNLPPTWPSILTKIEQFKRTIEQENKIRNAVVDQLQSSGENIISTDINSLCETYLEIVNRGIQNSDTFNCQVSNDFEKRLPQIKINPTAVGSLLINILTNAFQSVKEKSKQEIKGYIPKVVVSTRILPKFLQIRIRDNGIGMTEQQLQSAQEEFYSTRDMNEGCGLGLNISKSIISEMHKGEIKIESEPGNSTDVYIKFFI